MARSLSAPRPLLAFSFSAGGALPPSSVPVCTSLSEASLRLSALRLAVRLRADLADVIEVLARRRALLFVVIFVFVFFCLSVFRLVCSVVFMLVSPTDRRLKGATAQRGVDATHTSPPGPPSDSTFGAYVVMLNVKNRCFMCGCLDLPPRVVPPSKLDSDPFKSTPRDRILSPLHYLASVQLRHTLA